MNRKCIPTDSSVLCWNDFSQGSPEMRDPKPFTAARGLLHRFSNRFELKTIKITGQDVLADEEVLLHF